MAATSWAKNFLQEDEWKKAVDLAISRTQADYDGKLVCDFSLRQWTKRETFEELLAGIRSGKRTHSFQTIVESFISEGDFVYQGDVKAIAKDVLGTFSRHLHEELMTTRYASLLLSNQIAAGAEQQMHGFQQLNAKVDEIRLYLYGRPALGMIESPESSDSLVVGAPDAEREWKAKIDVAKNFMEDGKYRPAERILLDVRAETEGKTVSELTQFRVATNLGNCALHLGQSAQALPEYERALALRPADPDALSNMALGLMTNDRLEEAYGHARRAVGSGTRKSNVLATFIQLCGKTARFDDVERTLANNSWAADDPGVNGVCAEIYFRTEDYDKAESYARRSLEREPKDAAMLEILAVSIITPVQRKLVADPPLEGRIPEESLARIGEAETFLAVAVDVLRASERRDHYLEILEHRAAVRILLDRYDEALMDVDAILGERPGDRMVLKKKVSILARMDQFASAVKIQEQLLNDKAEAEDHVAHAQLLIDAEEPEKALAYLRVRWGELKGWRGPAFDAGEVYVRALLRTNEIEEMGRIISDLEGVRPGDSRVMALRARYLHLRGNADDALALLVKAAETATGNQRNFILLGRANMLCDLKRYAEAANIYRPLIDRNLVSPVSERFLIALLNSGQYKEALESARQMRGSRKVVLVISEVEARVLEHIGDTNSARAIWIELSKVEPKELGHLIRAVSISLGVGDKEAARGIVEPISLDRAKGNAQHLMALAEARHLLELPGVLEFAFQARREGFSNETMHMAYINLFLRREVIPGELNAPEKVVPNCAVRLKSEAGPQSYLLLDDVNAVPERAEIGPDSEAYRRLQGKAVGDQVSLRVGGVAESPYRLVEIQHRYVYAFQDSLDNFTRYFPGSSELQKVKIKKNDYSKVTAALEMRSKFTGQVETLYKAQRIPLHTFATLVRASVVEVWGSLVGRVGATIICSSGGEDEQKTGAVVIRNAERLIVDQTALLTLAFLGILERVQAFRKLVVPSAVLEELTKSLAKLPEPSQKMSTISKVGDTMYHHESSEEELREGRRFLENIITFIQTKTDIRANPEKLEMKKEDVDHWERLVGSGGFAASLIAKASGLPLFSDDFGLRRLANNSWQVVGASVLDVLKEMSVAGNVSGEERYEFLTKLMAANYFYVPVDVSFLAWLVRKRKYDVSGNVANVFKSLEGPVCTEESAVRVLADLLKELGGEPMLAHQRVMFIDLVLKSATGGRDAIAALRSLVRQLRSTFALLPVWLARILKEIDQWLRTSFLVRRRRDLRDLLM